MDINNLYGLDGLKVSEFLRNNLTLCVLNVFDKNVAINLYLLFLVIETDPEIHSQGRKDHIC